MSHLRLKWMKLKIRTDSKLIFEYIRTTHYSDIEGVGFTKFESIPNGISATFNKKSVVLEPISDPFGEILEFERVIFDQINFSLHAINSKTLLLTFYNPPKTVKPYIDFMSQAEGLSVAYGNLTLDTTKFMQIVRENFGFIITGISKVKVSNLPVTEKTKASLELNSVGDALHDLKEFIGESDFKLDKIKATGLYEESKISFELSSSASAMVPEDKASIFNEAMAIIETEKNI